MSSESGDDHEESEYLNEDEKTPIREELSKLSFEELQQLKERLGSKVYNEAMFGTSKKRTRQTSFKRENKNRPREMSSKIRVPLIPDAHSSKPTSKQRAPRDPRFDSLCGEYNEKAFKNSYMFLADIRATEKEQLKKELVNEEDEKRRVKIKYLIQRMENQDREEQKRKKLSDRIQVERATQIEALRQGQKPKYLNKTEKHVVDLVDKYEELKESGKLQKHLEKQRKKMASKDRKKMLVQT